jgi:hypothetical protein
MTISLDPKRISTLHTRATCPSPADGCRRCRGEMTCPEHGIARCTGCTACPRCAVTPGTGDNLAYVNAGCNVCSV